MEVGSRIILDWGLPAELYSNQRVQVFMDERGMPASKAIRDVDTSGQEWGSDYLVDLISAYGFEYVSFNPGASFRGIEESLVNYGENVDPSIIQTQNESLAVAVAHGYAKATGEPALCCLHDTVGTLNGAMALYNAYVDHVPVVVLGGNGPLRKTRRRPWIDWIHTNIDQASFIRDFVKWDDQPLHSDGVADTLLRGVRISETIPKGPVYLTIDHALQENRLEKPLPMPDFSQYEPPTRMAPDPGAISAAADHLVSAELPVILVDRVGESREAVAALVELADALGAAVVDTYGYFPHRYNFPNTHPMDLTGTDVIAESDVVVAIEVVSVDVKTTNVDRVTHEVERNLPRDAVFIEIGADDLEASSITHDYCELQPSELAILADPSLAVPALRDAVENRLASNPASRRIAAERSETLAVRHDERRESWRETAAEAAEESPIAPSYLAAELWEVIQDDAWVLVNGTLSGWSHRLWDIDEFDSFVGGMSGGGGVGYGIGAAIGAALAYESSDRVPINLQSDGDLMQFLAGLWSVAHHDVGLFTVVHNNGCLYNSTRHRMDLAEARGRDSSFERALIGTSVADPTPDYAALAEAQGVWSYGPVEDPLELRETLQAAWADALAGRPVLVDVVSQPR